MNNGSKIWEVHEGIIDKILSILGSALLVRKYMCVCTYVLDYMWCTYIST